MYSPAQKTRNSVYSCTDKVAAEKNDTYTTVLKQHIIKKQNRTLKEALPQTSKLSEDEVPWHLPDHTSTTKHEHCYT